MSFDICIHSCNHHHHHDREQFYQFLASICPSAVICSLCLLVPDMLLSFFLEFHRKRVIQYIVFKFDLFHWPGCFRVSFILLPVSKVCSDWLLSSTLLYGYTVTHLFIRWQTSALFPDLGRYEKSCEHVRAKEWNCWVTWSLHDSLLQSCHNGFQSGCTIFYSHQ